MKKLIYVVQVVAGALLLCLSVSALGFMVRAVVKLFLLGYNVL